MPRTERQSRYYLKHHERLLKENRIKQRARVAKHTARLARIKLRAGCLRCGSRPSAARMDFHHRDPTTKRKNVSQMALYSEEAIIAEIEKCDVFCKSCHKKTHNEMRVTRTEDGDVYTRTLSPED